MVASHVALGNKGGGAVNVSCSQDAGGGEYGVGFAQTGRADSADNGGIVRSGNCYRNDLLCTIGGCYGDAVRVVGAGCKFVMSTISDVAPDTSSRDTKFTVCMVACHVALGDKGCGAINISSA